MLSRRDAIQGLLGIGVAATALPKEWVKPVVNQIVLPAHAMTSCSGFTTEPINESITITVTSAEIQGPIVVARNGGSTFSGSDTTTIDSCRDGQNLTVEVNFSGELDSANNQITGDLTIIQRCGPDLVCEQISTYSATQAPVDSGSDLGDYEGTVIGTLRCCDDFS